MNNKKSHPERTVNNVIEICLVIVGVVVVPVALIGFVVVKLLGMIDKGN